MSSQRRKLSDFADGASTSGSSGYKVDESSQKRNRPDFEDDASTSGYKYDVFLSFRGPDTRRTFADYLYESLVGAGLTVFRDDEELRAGANIAHDIEGAIDDSRIHLPIFSAGYASSAWCLRELAHMVKLQREPAGREIVPIFYDVSPSDVKLRTGSYREALLKHEGRYGEGTVREWMEALVEVGNLSGLDARDKPLGKLVNDLVRELSIKLKKRQMVLPGHLVGIDDRVEDVMRILDCGSEDVRFIALWGMGGIGKTTIAKALFNQIFSHFDGHSFLSNVRERSQTDNGIKRLQNQLLSDILKKPIGVHDVDEGINMIKERFHRKKVLVVLDDVDQVEKLTSLAGNSTWFNSGSRIIITTRNADLMPAAERGQQDNVPFLPVYYAYEMTEMNPCHALELFSWHAFRKKRPPNEYDILSSEIVATLGGLPLALETAGSYLRLQSVGIWSETLERLRKVPDGRVQEMLRITYEALTFEEKQIFLDIACFFKGVERTSAACVWKECGFFPERGLATLTNMSLLKIDPPNTLWMHDLIRDFGRTIVQEEDRLNARNRSRLWESEECLHVLSEQIYHQPSNVVSLRLQFPRVQTLTNQDFTALPNLRLLHVEGAKFTGDYKNVFRVLRWLSWDRCPAEFDATNFSPSNLVILKLSGTELTDDWPGWHQILKSSKLKVLELEECSRLTRLPDLSALSTVGRLTVKNCHSLVEIGESIGKLVQLNYLEIDACTCLRGLPEEVGCLKALKELIVRGTILGPVGSYLPHSIGNLQSLTRLEMECVRISELPHSIGELKDLESLCLSRCDELRELPDSVGGLKLLVGLDLSYTKVTELPSGIGSVSFLKILNLSHTCIQTVPTTIDQLSHLQELYLEDCHELEQIPELPASLIILNLSHTCIQTVPTTIDQLSHLQELYLEDCHELEQIPELPASLIILYIESRSLKRVPNLSNLTNLVDLIISDYSEEPLSKPRDVDSIQTPNLEWVGRLSRLEKLKLVHKSIIVLPTELASLPGLERLVLSCFYLQSLIQPLPSALSTLKLINFNLLADLSPHADFKNLSSLELCKSWLTEIPLNRFGQLENLRELTVSNCTNLRKLSCLSGSKKLRVVRLLNCLRLVEIQGLEELESLENIRIDHCSSLVRLPSLSKLKKLRTIKFISCRSLVSLPFLSGVASEDCHLVVEECDKLANHNGPCQHHKYRRQCPNPIRTYEPEYRQHSPCPVSI